MLFCSELHQFRKSHYKCQRLLVVFELRITTHLCLAASVKFTVIQCASAIIYTFIVPLV